MDHEGERLGETDVASEALEPGEEEVGPREAGTGDGLQPEYQSRRTEFWITNKELPLYERICRGTASTYSPSTSFHGVSHLACRGSFVAGQRAAR